MRKIISDEILLLFAIRRQSIAALAACGLRSVLVSLVLPRPITQARWSHGTIETCGMCMFGFVGPRRKRWKGIIPGDCIRRYRWLNDPISSWISGQLASRNTRLSFLSRVGRLTGFRMLMV